MKKRVLIFYALFALTFSSVVAQNKTLGVGASSPSPNAALHVESPTGNQGFIMPRLTTAQRTAMTTVLTTADNGLMLYDTNLNTIYIWNGSAWRTSAQVAGGVKLTYPYSDTVVTATGTPDLFALRYNNAENKRVMRIENMNAANGSSTLSVANAGVGVAGYFQSSNNATTSSTLYATTNSDAGGALAPVAVYGESTGTGSLGGAFWNQNATNTYPALYAKTLGTGSAITGETSSGFSAIVGKATGGFSNGVSGLSASTDPGSYAVLGQNSGGGPAGVFGIANATNSSNALEVSTTGVGHAGMFSVSNAANSSIALQVSTAGTGTSGLFEITNGSSGSPSIISKTSGTGTALQAETSTGFSALFAKRDGASNGNAGIFDITNSANTYPSLQANTVGTGSAGNFQINNASSNAPAVFAQTNGPGSAFSGDNTSTGDVVSVVKTGTSGSAGNFQVNNAGNAASAIFGMTNAANGHALGLINSANGNAFTIFTGGMKVSTFSTNASPIMTRAAAYQITTGGATSFTFDNSLNLTGGEIFLIYNDSGSSITVQSISIPAGEGRTIINFGGTFRGF